MIVASVIVMTIAVVIAEIDPANVVEMIEIIVMTVITEIIETITIIVPTETTKIEEMIEIDLDLVIALEIVKWLDMVTSTI